MLIARPLVTGRARNAVERHVLCMFPCNVRICGAGWRYAMAGTAAWRSRDRGMALRAGGAALRHAPEVCPVAIGIRAARCPGGGRQHKRSMVRARVSQPPRRMYVRNSSHVAAGAGRPTVGNAGKECSMAILVRACGGPGRARIDIRAMRAVYGAPIRWVYGRGAAQMAKRTGRPAVENSGKCRAVAGLVRTFGGTGRACIDIRPVSAVYGDPA